MLALVPHGVAPLVAVAGLCAAGLVMARPPYRFAALRSPAICLFALLAWGAASAIWAVDPQRSLMLDIRLAGLCVAGLALAMAAGRLAKPRRLARFLLAGIAGGLALTWYDLASGGGLSRHISVRVFHPFRLNQIAVGLAILALPVAAWLIERSRWAVALMVAAVVVGTIGLLHDVAAKTALALSLPVMGLLYCWRRPVARLAAILSVIGILTAPLTLPALGRLPAVLAGTEEIRPGLKRLPLHPHNAALQLWLELGVPGALLSAFFIGWLWLQLGAAPWPRLYAAAAGGSLTAAFVTASGAYGIWQEWWLGTLGLALFAVLVMGRAAEPPAAATPPPRRGWRGGGR